MRNKKVGISLRDDNTFSFYVSHFLFLILNKTQPRARHARHRSGISLLNSMPPDYEVPVFTGMTSG